MLYVWINCPLIKGIWSCPKHVWNEWQVVEQFCGQSVKFCSMFLYVTCHMYVMCCVAMSDLLWLSRASCRGAAPSQQRRCILWTINEDSDSEILWWNERETEAAIQSGWDHFTVLVTCRIWSLLIKVLRWGCINAGSVIVHMAIIVHFFNWVLSGIRGELIGVEWAFCRWLKWCTHKGPHSTVKSSFNWIWAYLHGVFILKGPRKRQDHENILP